MNGGFLVLTSLSEGYQATLDVTNHVASEREYSHVFGSSSFTFFWAQKEQVAVAPLQSGT